MGVPFVPCPGRSDPRPLGRQTAPPERSLTIARPTIGAVLFDMDGLLLDTEPIYTRATQQVVAPYGKTFDWSVKSRMIGRPAAVSAQILVDALELPMTPAEYLERRESIMIELFPEAPAKPGARELAEHLSRQGVPCAVATSSSLPHFEAKTSRHQDWFEAFQAVVTADHPDVRHGKPAPDIFLTAARALGASPEACLVFEDAPSGVEAARAAGMSVIAVPDPAMDHAPFAEADLILSGLAEFDPVPWGLPG